MKIGQKVQISKDAEFHAGKIAYFRFYSEYENLPDDEQVAVLATTEFPIHGSDRLIAVSAKHIAPAIE